MTTLRALTRDLQEVVAGRSFVGDGPQISSIEIDSRRCRPGSLFVALRGASFDGHDFVESALDAGASALLVDRQYADGHAPSAPYLVAQDTRKVLGPLAAMFYGDPSRDVAVIGVTGTNGKTTVSWLLETAAAAAGCKPGLVGTIQTRWEGFSQSSVNTTPESLQLQMWLRQMRNVGVDTLLMEVSSHGLATHRMRGTRLCGAVFTNLSRDHLDFHKTMDAYRKAKEELFRMLLESAENPRGRPFAAINIDDPVGAHIASTLEGEDVDLYRVSLHQEAEICLVKEPMIDLAGIQVEAQTPDGVVRLGSSIPARYQATNVLLSLACACAMGWDLLRVAQALEEMAPIPGRLQRISPKTPAVFVDYSHTPDALENTLANLRALHSGRLVVVFGCGGDRDQGKRPQMGHVAGRLADLVVVTSDNPRHEDPEEIMAEIVAGVDGRADVEMFADRRQAIEWAIRNADESTLVLIAGKGHEDYQEVCGERVPFDDREIAESVLSRVTV